MAEGASNDPSPPVALAADDGTESGGGKIFFTTSDLIARINQSVAEVSSDGDGNQATTGAAAAPTGGFELRRQMPDGSTRRADEADTAVADLQSKIKQTAAVLSALSAEEKVEWAQQQRAEGNKLFARGEHAEAMDVYITCLVAMDKLRGSADAGGDEQAKDKEDSSATASAVFSESIQREIQLPVLLNLALCALKLGMLRKAESFCNFALQTSLGADCPKAHFRRGRARMLMGSYDDARVDLQRALGLLQNANADGVDEDNGSKTNDDSSAGAAQEAELKAVKKELQKLERLEIIARKHEKEQRKAMKRLWDDDQNTRKSNAVEANGRTPDAHSTSSSAADTTIAESSTVKAEKSEVQSNANVESKKGLYSDVRERRHFSTLRAKKRIAVSAEEEDDDEDDDMSPSFFQWYLSLFERCLRKTLHILGDEEGARMEHPTSEDKDK